MRRNVKRKLPPSRIRYEQNNPTVSCRVPLEVYERLQAVREAEGKSFADLLKIGLEIVEPKIKTARKARTEGFDEGYEEGYADAEHKYKVTYACRKCRKTTEITSQAEKEAVKSYMEEQGWGHNKCP